ncbi:MAG: putative toxin-antitoxin system toxin component, PIN family [Omnitrophica bacterium RIFCSPLOWO2_01_FULL_45_24]|nr:MAG: putative toxin-antitoxin system toxin component, PIN family [Omnitrophica bacterium RIFCSPLOWO2_01_FULL_45_24]
MRVVIDTNVLVSGLLSPYGAGGEIVRMAVAGSLDLLYDARIVSEYEEVLSRPKFSFDKAHIDNLIEFITHFGIPVSATPLSIHLSDMDDEPFLEVAISGKAECLITGNAAHYPMRPKRKVRVLAPRQFLNRYF